MKTKEEIKKGDFKILIVEDEEDQRIRLKYVLESDEYQVDEAKNGDEAIGLINNNFYNLVITDLKMPGKNDGVEVLRTVRKISENTDVIIVTAYGTVDSAIRAMINGAFDYIQKPIKMPELRIKIERAIKNRSVINKLESKEIVKSNVKALTLEIESYKMKLMKIHKKSKELLSSLKSDDPVCKAIKEIIEQSNI